jgi:hypothetical protein
VFVEVGVFGVCWDEFASGVGGGAKGHMDNLARSRFVYGEKRILKNVVFHHAVRSWQKPDF